MAQRNGTSAPCKGCGATIHREPGSTGPVPHYCGPDCRPRCSVEDCKEPLVSRGWCSFHYTRWKLAGDPLAPTLRSRPYRGATCLFDGCEKAQRKSGWCTGHYGQSRSGRVLAPLVPKSNSWTCLACGGPSGTESGFRRFCSGRCKARWKTHDGQPPLSFCCVLCDTEVPYLRSDGRRRRSDSRVCPACRRQSRFCVTTGLLAKRDGAICTLCLSAVDMSLRAPDLMCGSVDHIIPRSKGGPDVPENCQLAHLICNIRKRDRVPS